MIAVSQREEIKSWIRKNLATAPWKKCMRDSFTLDALSTQKSWRDMIKDAGKLAKDRNLSKGDIVRKIEKAVLKYLKSSPRQEILKGQAYAWLKYIQKYPPHNAWWFPRYAIEVAHRAFVLKGPLANFKRYLGDPTRTAKLHFILTGAAFYLKDCCLDVHCN